jgi:hypothetical protein
MSELIHYHPIYGSDVLTSNCNCCGVTYPLNELGLNDECNNCRNDKWENKNPIVFWDNFDLNLYKLIKTAHENQHTNRKITK